MSWAGRRFDGVWRRFPQRDAGRGRVRMMHHGRCMRCDMVRRAVVALSLIGCSEGQLGSPNVDGSAGGDTGAPSDTGTTSDTAPSSDTGAPADSAITTDSGVADGGLSTCVVPSPTAHLPAPTVYCAMPTLGDVIVSNISFVADVTIIGWDSGATGCLAPLAQSFPSVEPAARLLRVRTTTGVEQSFGLILPVLEPAIRVGDTAHLVYEAKAQHP